MQKLQDRCRATSDKNSITIEPTNELRWKSTFNPRARQTNHLLRLKIFKVKANTRFSCISRWIHILERSYKECARSIHNIIILGYGFRLRRSLVPMPTTHKRQVVRVSLTYILLYKYQKQQILSRGFLILLRNRKKREQHSITRYKERESYKEPLDKPTQRKE